MNSILKTILTSRDEVLTQARENLMANRLHDESAADAFDRLQRNGQLGKLLSPLGQPLKPVTNNADDGLGVMPE